MCKGFRGNSVMAWWTEIRRGDHTFLTESEDSQRTSSTRYGVGFRLRGKSERL